MQKTAYEMRISDWSADVCSADLQVRTPENAPEETFHTASARSGPCWDGDEGVIVGVSIRSLGIFEQLDDIARWILQQDLPSRSCLRHFPAKRRKLGRASCRERVCQYV